jgi:hypothetical protein
MMRFIIRAKNILFQYKSSTVLSSDNFKYTYSNINSVSMNSTLSINGQQRSNSNATSKTTFQLFEYYRLAQI